MSSEKNIEKEIELIKLAFYDQAQYHNAQSENDSLSDELKLIHITLASSYMDLSLRFEGRTPSHQKEQS